MYEIDSINSNNYNIKCTTDCNQISKVAINCTNQLQDRDSSKSITTTCTYTILKNYKYSSMITINDIIIAIAIVQRI